MKNELEGQIVHGFLVLKCPGKSPEICFCYLSVNRVSWKVSLCCEQWSLVYTAIA